ncbi:MAG: SMP-30/gluconolactonase/LRE family protein, partial [Betaproteobacteria bacterium]|nr:SMP-30/gluconolactonase/LRE family protein [Betaproteobacteria bacterium]
MPRQAAKPSAASVAGAAALDKAFALVDAIAAAPMPPTAAALAAATTLPRSTLFRLLGALEAHGYVRRDPRERGWRLGFRLFELAQGAWSAFDLRDAALDEIATLRERTGETVQLAVLDGDECVVVGGADGTQAIRHAAALGQRSAWTGNAAGLALVAFADATVRAALLAALPAAARAGQEAAIELARGRGYAVGADSGDGVADVAAPVLDVRGSGAAALVLAGPAYRLDPARLHALAPLLMAAARRVSHDAGGTAMSLSSSPSPGAPSRGVRVAQAGAALLGEAPYWSAHDAALWWVDMLAPALWRYDPRTRGAQTFPLPRLTSVAVPRRRGGFLLARPDGLHLAAAPGDPGTRFAHPGSEAPDNRYNDGKCDAHGRLWIATLDPTGKRGRGSLYRVDPDGRSQRVDTGFTVANGLAFSPDGSTLYFAESAQRAILAYDLDARGNARGRRTFATFPEGVKPDGIAVDAEGGVWVALWDGWRVERLSPEGRLSRTLRLPVPRPTSVAFGGAALDRLYVTSARVRLDPDSLAAAPLSGALF